jgi:hypothetical protein
MVWTSIIIAWTLDSYGWMDMPLVLHFSFRLLFLVLWHVTRQLDNWMVTKSGL